MAKRAPTEEKPYRPVEDSLIRSVLAPSPQEQPAPEIASPKPPLLVEERLEREKRMLLTPSEEREIEQLVGQIASEVGASVKLSHVLRACTTLLLECRHELLRHAREAPRMARPANGNLSRIQEFDRGLARIMADAIRDAPHHK